MKRFVIALGGVIFGAGLAVSEMVRPEVVLSFLQLVDLGLLFVLGGGALVAAGAFWLGQRFLEGPFLGGAFSPPKRAFDKKTVYGAVLFGLGWGVSGVCPGSALGSLGVGNWPILLAIAGMFLGAYVHGRWLAS